MGTKLTVTDYITRFETPKTVLAERIGIHRVELYAFLEPSKYPKNPLSDDRLQKIATFEGRSLASVKREYEQRASKAA